MKIAQIGVWRPARSQAVLARSNIHCEISDWIRAIDCDVLGLVQLLVWESWYGMIAATTEDCPLYLALGTKKAGNPIFRIKYTQRQMKRRLMLHLLFGILFLPSWSLNAQVESATAGRGKKITMVRIEENSIVINGDLDELEWNRAGLAKDFIQSEPYFGKPASETTEVRLLYDRHNLYIGVYCFDSEGAKGVIVQDMARDFSGSSGDLFQVVFDTFNDDRNGFVFGTNPRGAKRDMQVAGDGLSFNRDWDAVWHIKSKVTDRGWQAEFAIPFKTLRFRRGERQVWGVNFYRSIRRKNERTYWAPIPRPHRLYRVSMAGSLEGISGIRQGRNLYVKPYLSAPVLRREEDDVDFMPDAGLDIKYGVTSGLTLDLTVNTEFSQVEADDVQINFTRFSLFFPEKREFFLENREIFEFGNPGFRGFSGRRRGGRASLFRPRNDLIPFFSRRIGVSDDGRLIPILGGARLTGRAGRYRLGVISMQTDEFRNTPSTNFSVVRLRRDLFRGSDIGLLFINKLQAASQFNRTYGADANFRFFKYLDLSSYFLNTDTPGIAGEDGAGFFRIAWRDRLLDVDASHISIEKNFNAEVGFVQRGGFDREKNSGKAMRKNSGKFNLTPRPEGRIPWVREFRPGVEVDYITDGHNTLETREVISRFSIEFNDTSFFSVGRRFTLERLVEADEILDQILDPGDYRFAENTASFSTDRRRMLRGSLNWSDGEFYNGERTSYGVGLGISPNPQLGLDLFWEHADLSFPTQDFSVELVSTRVAYSFTTNMFLDALIQYSSHEGLVASNIRFNLIHKPLSDFFLVYNEQRSPEGDVLDRALIAKVTYLLNF